MATVHELKCWPPFFAEIREGNKTFEVRQDDRNFRVGDLLHLREYRPHTQTYTGRECWVDVTYLLAGDWPGLAAGYVIMSIVRRRDAEP